MTPDIPMDDFVLTTNDNDISMDEDEMSYCTAMQLFMAISHEAEDITNTIEEKTPDQMQQHVKDMKRNLSKICQLYNIEDSEEVLEKTRTLLSQEEERVKQADRAVEDHRQRVEVLEQAIDKYEEGICNIGEKLKDVKTGLVFMKERHEQEIRQLKADKEELNQRIANQASLIETLEATFADVLAVFRQEIKNDEVNDNITGTMAADSICQAIQDLGVNDSNLWRHAKEAALKVIQDQTDSIVNKFCQFLLVEEEETSDWRTGPGAWKDTDDEGSSCDSCAGVEEQLSEAECERLWGQVAIKQLRVYPEPEW